MDDLTKDFKEASTMSNYDLHRLILTIIERTKYRDDMYWCLNCFKYLGCDALDEAYMCWGCYTCYCDTCADRLKIVKDEEEGLLHEDRCFTCKQRVKN